VIASHQRLAPSSTSRAVVRLDDLTRRDPGQSPSRLNILQHVELGAFGAECGITFGGFASWKAKLFIQTQRLSSEVGQTTGLMGDRAARIGGCGVPVPRAKP